MARVTRVRQRVDPDSRVAGPVSSNPDKSYVRFVRNTDRRKSYMTSRGFEVAKPEDLADGHGGYERDGAIVKGDLIAMVQPAERHAEHVEDSQAAMRAMEEAQQEMDEREGLTHGSGHGKTRGGRFTSIP